MDLRFNASGRMIWDVATAVAWRLDPDRLGFSGAAEDPHLREAIEGIYVAHAETVQVPPRLRQELAALETRFPDAVPDMVRFVVTEHIFAALRPDITVEIQDPDRAPFLIINQTAPADAILVDIDAMLREYRGASARMPFSREQEETIKKVIRNSVTPRFDRVEVKLEGIGQTLDATHRQAAETREAMDSGFREVLKEMRKRTPPKP